MNTDKATAPGKPELPHEDASYWRKRTDEYSLQLAATHNHAEKLAEALEDVLDDKDGADDRADAALAAWEKAKQ